MGSRRPSLGFHLSLYPIALLLLSIMATAASAKPIVLASIKPLAFIAQEVAGDQAVIDTLLPITASAHDYPLKMSDHRRLRDADLVLWVGAELESFLARPLANLPAQKVLSSYHLEGLYWPAPAHDDDHHHLNHQHTNKDPHLWLDPRNAVVIAQAIAQRLGQILPASAEQFSRNAEQFKQAVGVLDTQLGTQLAPVSKQGFAVYHEGYSHFVSRYSLHQLAYVTYTPERRPGARHLQELRKLLAKEGRCVFLEPYQHNRAIEDMVLSLGLKLGLLEPMGNPQVSTYSQLMELLAQSFLTCLADGADRSPSR